MRRKIRDGPCHSRLTLRCPTSAAGRFARHHSSSSSGGSKWPGSRALARLARKMRSEEHTSELQSLMRISYAVFCLKKKIIILQHHSHITILLLTHRSHSYTRYMCTSDIPHFQSMRYNTLY